jgi:hypothetical protein
MDGSMVRAIWNRGWVVENLRLEGLSYRVGRIFLCTEFRRWMDCG